MSLETYRKEIDKVDSRILELLAQRRDLAILVGKYKKANGLQILVPEREKAIIENKVKMAEKYSLNKSFVQDVFQLIIEYCRKEQK